VILLFALMAATLVQSAPVTVDLWNDLADDVTVSAPGGATGAIPHYKDASFTAPSDARQLTVSVKGCDYMMVLPGALSDFREEGGDGHVRLYLSDDMKIYIVPSDVILQTPPAFLTPQQPLQFPIDPGKSTCKR
jgi:hypothetical protein